MSENQIQTFKSLRQTRAVSIQFIACAICILLYIIDDFFATELTARFVGVGLFLFGSISIFIGYLSISHKDIILFSPELWRLRRIEKEKGIDAANRLYQKYAKRYRQIGLGIMEILPGFILFIISIGMIVG